MSRPDSPRMRKVNELLREVIAEAVTDQISKAQYFPSLAVGSLSENMRGGMMRQAMQIDGGSKPVAGFQDFPLVTARAS